MSKEIFIIKFFDYGMQEYSIKECLTKAEAKTFFKHHYCKKIWVGKLVHDIHHLEDFDFRSELKHE